MSPRTYRIKATHGMDVVRADHYKISSNALLFEDDQDQLIACYAPGEWLVFWAKDDE